MTEKNRALTYNEPRHALFQFFYSIIITWTARTLHAALMRHIRDLLFLKLFKIKRQQSNDGYLLFIKNFYLPHLALFQQHLVNVNTTIAKGLGPHQQ